MSDTQPSTLLAPFLTVREQLLEQLIDQGNLIDRLFIALLTGGHVLIEGAPGLAKTRAITRFATKLNADFARIQATPDLLPADITGTDVYNQHTGQFSFLAGPVFNHIVLVDEINRAPPKVQSALLEAMAERQVSSGGVSRALAEPFMVAATQNPIEHEGTYPLPEAQLDRFLFFIHVPTPDAATERRILDTVLNERLSQATIQTTSSNDSANASISLEVLQQARQEVIQIHISEAVRDYIVRLVMATRGHGAGARAAESITQSSSPRGSLYLAQAAQAYAWLHGRAFVVPEDVSALACDVLSGRIALHYQARANGISTRDVIAKLLLATPKV